MNEGFLSDPWIGMLFFRICSRYGVQSNEDRILLMRELVRRKKAKYLRDIKPFIDGKKVLQVKYLRPKHGPKEPK